MKKILTISLLLTAALAQASSVTMSIESNLFFAQGMYKEAQNYKRIQENDDADSGVNLVMHVVKHGIIPGLPGVAVAHMANHCKNSTEANLLRLVGLGLIAAPIFAYNREYFQNQFACMKRIFNQTK